MSIIAPPQILIGPGMAGTLMTPEEFDAIEEVDRDYRYELIDGRLIVTPPPLEAERGPNEELGFLLRLYRHAHPQGSALDDTLPEQTVVTGSNRRRADRVIWAGLGRQPDPAQDLPSIVAEWVSESKREWQRDYVEKKTGVPGTRYCRILDFRPFSPDVDGLPRHSAIAGRISREGRRDLSHAPLARV